MCGRIVQASDPLAIVEGPNAPGGREKPPSYNVAPSQLLYLIRENHDTGERVLGLLRSGLIPHGCTDPDGGRKPINARAESVAQLPTFREAPLHLAGQLFLCAGSRTASSAFSNMQTPPQGWRAALLWRRQFRVPFSPEPNLVATTMGPAV